MRGNPPQGRFRVHCDGSIPAYAGEPIAGNGQPLWGTVYPRVCGGTPAGKPSRTRPHGLSPRMRGNHSAWSTPRRTSRSIPAYAGEPYPDSAARNGVAVYPRVCGGTLLRRAGQPGGGGLSPRMRGNRRAGLTRSPRPGSIPAYAGEPTRCGGQWQPRRVYPRVCGGTAGRNGESRRLPGLSPRMRGNQHQCGYQMPPAGSIPAYAGEPGLTRTGWTTCRVYPRVCGGTRRLVDSAGGRLGLSPRMRGNPRFDIGRFGLDRSIPAYAGEPPAELRPDTTERVYPRVCGGTVVLLAPAGIAGAVYPRVCGGTRRRFRASSAFRGLSPRMRGNRRPFAVLQPPQGSIPAYAGEPGGGGADGRLGEVYPRVCGGTCLTTANMDERYALSPRMRGNLRLHETMIYAKRSIPAYAGEPSRWWGMETGSRVYPRVCGGTLHPEHDGTHSTGLSPRMRGNRQRRHGRGHRRRSIPAYAGEPERVVAVAPLTTVYPRVCGGTIGAGISGQVITGLSPRMRGNRWSVDASTRSSGPIPAYAGEPAPGSTALPEGEVYPRVCGGTLAAPGALGGQTGLSPRMRGNRTGT